VKYWLIGGDQTKSFVLFKKFTFSLALGAFGFVSGYKK